MKIWGTGLAKGLGITIRNMFRPPITVRYPREKIELPERARWTVASTFNDDGSVRCTACLSCVRACPDHVLDIEFEVAEDKSKHIEHFRYESAACMMCGLCIEACPFDAIHQTHDYELARTSIAEFTYDLLTDVDAAGPRRKAAPAAPTAGEGADD